MNNNIVNILNLIFSNDKPNIAHDSIRTNAINPNHFIVINSVGRNIN